VALRVFAAVGTAQRGNESVDDLVDAHINGGPGV